MGEVMCPHALKYIYKPINIHMVNMAVKRKDAAGVRKDRIQRIHNMITGAGKVPLSRFLATIDYQMGLSRDTVKKYLATLVDMGLVEVNESNDWVKEVKPE